MGSSFGSTPPHQQGRSFLPQSATGAKVRAWWKSSEALSSLAGTEGNAGTEGFQFNDLRDTFATRLGDQGCTATTIAALLGHANTHMTARYTHATDDALRAAVERAQNRRVTMASQTLKQPPTLVAVND
jgi:site-specific recombinase XerD